MNIVVGLVAVAWMAICVILIPLGLPGLWMIGVGLLALLVLGQLSWGFALVGVGAVVAAEIAEFWVLRSFGARFGGSSRAFWGAVLGGMAGLFVGLPVPVVGPMVTVFLGSFLGAGLVTYFETRSVESSARVGWGMLLARTTAVALKMGVALALAAATTLALLFGD